MDRPQADTCLAPPTRRPTLARWWLRLLDGSHVWGSFDAMVGRYGLWRYRLTLLPPGVAATDRRLLRAWRGWSLGGVALALLATICLSNAIYSATTTLIVCAGAYVVVGAALFALTGVVRAQARSLSVIVIDGYPDSRSDAMYRQWEALVEILTAADHAREHGELSPVEYEAVWWRAYNRLESAGV